MTSDLVLSRTYGGMLLMLPPPAETRISDDLLREADPALLSRSREYCTVHALNAFAVYRLGTLERGTWTATLVEWART